MSTQTVESKNEFTYEQKQKIDEPKLNIIFWVFSCISWLLLIITGWISIKWLDNKVYYVIWTIYVERNLEKLLLLTFSNACRIIIYSLYFIFSYNFIRIYSLLY